MLFSEIFSEFSSPPKKIHNFFPPVDLRIIFFELRLQESHFSHRFGRFLRFGVDIWMVSPRLDSSCEAARVCGLRFANEEVAQLEADRRPLPRAWEGMGDRGSDAPPNHGGAKRSLLL